MNGKIVSLAIVVLMVVGSFGAIGITMKALDVIAEPQDFVSGEVIVGFSEEINVENLKVGDIDPILGCKIVQIIEGINVVVVTVEEGKEDKYVDDYMASPMVSYAEKNAIVSVADDPNDPAWGKQWGPKNIKCPEGWPLAGSSNAVLAIIDTGIDLDHEDLGGRLWDDGSGHHGYDFVNDDNNPDDDEGHGTHCAGTAVAITNNGKGIAGVAGEAPVELMAVKVLSYLGSGTAADVAAGIDYARKNGAHVISMSLGSGSSSTTIKNACRDASNDGIVIVAAAGNDGVTDRHYPAGHNEYVIAVAAINSNNERAYFSNYGDWVDIAAPGVHIYSTYKGNGYKFLSGTSMACPHVAGVAALGKTRGWSRDTIWQKLETTADDVGDFVLWGKVDATYDGEEAPPEDFKVEVKINKIIQKDEIDIDGSPAEWYYEIVTTSSGEQQIREIFDQSGTLKQGMDEVGIKYYENDWVERETWNAGNIHKFNIYGGDLTFDIQIILMDSDLILHDLADISSRESSDLLPVGEDGRTFMVTYDLINNEIISGDKSEPLGSDYFPRYTDGGKWDGSDGDEPFWAPKQDDARLEFEITDNYDPKADGGDSYTGIENVEIQFTGKVTGAKPPFTYKWTFGDGGTSDSKDPTHKYSSTGTYEATLTITDALGSSDTDDDITVNVNKNSKPNKPGISGPIQGKGGTPIKYSFTVSDPDGKYNDKIYLKVDWGDGDSTDWLGPFDSGYEYEASHTWKETILPKDYTITAYVKDINGAENQGTKAVTMPKNKQLINLELGIYVETVKKISFPITIIVGSIDIKIDAEGASKVEFYIDDELKAIDDDTTDNTYVWTWDEFSFGGHTLKVITYDNAGNENSDEMKVWKFF